MFALSKHARAAFSGGVSLIVSLAPTLAPAQVVRTGANFKLPAGGATTDRGLKESDFPRIQKVADNVYVFEALHQSIKTLQNNSLIVITTEGVLVVDGHGRVEDVQKLVDEVRKLTPQPIRYMVIGSDHGDHTGGMSGFPQTATFIAHPATKAILEARAAVQKPGAPRVVIPTELVSDKRTLKMGNTQIDILHLGRAHTFGDLAVHLPRENIVWLSESFQARVFPSQGSSGHPSEWVEVFKRAQQMNARHYLGAHGFMDGPEVMKEEMVNYLRALELIVAEGKRLHSAGVPYAEAAKQANFGDFVSWYRFTENGAAAIQKAWLEADGRLPGLLVQNPPKPGETR